MSPYKITPRLLVHDHSIKGKTIWNPNHGLHQNAYPWPASTHILWFLVHACTLVTQYSSHIPSKEKSRALCACLLLHQFRRHQLNFDPQQHKNTVTTTLDQKVSKKYPEYIVAFTTTIIAYPTMITPIMINHTSI